MRILLCDDHGIVREGLRAILAEQGLEVVGEARSGREAIAMATRLRPAVVLMDISMPDLNGVLATQRLLVEAPESKVIALSMHADHRYVTAMFRAGASGYVVKSSLSEELMQAIHCVTNNGRYVSPTIAGVDLEQTPASGAVASSESRSTPAIKVLSAREREVLQLVADGMSTKEIATALDIATSTVETHRRQLMDKLNLRTVAELTKYALREGLTSLD